MIYGYCRISTCKQSIERQIRNIISYEPNATIKQEVYTGTSTARPIFNKLLKAIKQGDTIIFDSVSRMSRNAKDGYELYEKLYNKGINLVFIKEPQINTETFKTAIKGIDLPNVETGEQATNSLINGILTAINDYTMALAKKQIQLAFEQAEKEVKDLQQRTKEGLITAKNNGKKIGKPKGRTHSTKKEIEMISKIKQLSKNFDGNLKDSQVLELLHISRNAYYKYKSKIKSEIAVETARNERNVIENI